MPTFDELLARWEVERKATTRYEAWCRICTEVAEKFGGTSTISKKWWNFAYHTYHRPD